MQEAKKGGAGRGRKFSDMSADLAYIASSRAARVTLQRPYLRKGVELGDGDRRERVREREREGGNKDEPLPNGHFV